MWGRHGDDTRSYIGDQFYPSDQRASHGLRLVMSVFLLLSSLSLVFLLHSWMFWSDFEMLSSLVSASSTRLDIFQDWKIRESESYVIGSLDHRVCLQQVSIFHTWRYQGK